MVVDIHCPKKLTVAFFNDAFESDVVIMVGLKMVVKQGSLNKLGHADRTLL